MSRRDGEGTCDRCARTFGYYLVHNGFNDSAYGYCDACGMTALFSGWSDKIPSGVELPLHGPIDVSVTAYTRSCTCGGRFRGTASPRCPGCKHALSAVAAAAFIERNAPVAKKGWRWEQSWIGLYAMVINDMLANDPWKN